MVLKEVKDKLGLVKKEDKVGILIDGPNILRKEFDINLNSVKEEIENHGEMKVGKVFLDQYAPDKLIEAVTTQGFEPIITGTDVDVAMAAEAITLVFNPAIDTIALMTRDADFQPVLMKAKSKGKNTLVLGVEPGFSTALKNTADEVVMMGKIGEAEK